MESYEVTGLHLSTESKSTKQCKYCSSPINIAAPKCRHCKRIEAKRNEYMGKRFTTKAGDTVKIVEYNSGHDTIIEFEDGHRQKTAMSCIKKGSIKNTHGKYVNPMVTDKRNEYIGNKFTISGGFIVTVVEYNGSLDVVVEFEDGHRQTTAIHHLKTGNIKNLYTRSLFNTGYFWDGKHKCMINGVMTKEYAIWKNMIERSYAAIQKQRAYINCTVADGWHNFQNFADYYCDNVYESTMSTHMILDKDILSKNSKVYSPETCLMVPDTINKIFVRSTIEKRDCPPGVCKVKDRNKYRAKITDGGMDIHLGLFDTPEQAFSAYKKEKEAHIKKKAIEFLESIAVEHKQREMPGRVYRVLMNYKIEIEDSGYEHSIKSENEVSTTDTSNEINNNEYAETKNGIFITSKLIHKDTGFIAGYKLSELNANGKEIKTMTVTANLVLQNVHHIVNATIGDGLLEIYNEITLELV